MNTERKRETKRGQAKRQEAAGAAAAQNGPSSQRGPSSRPEPARQPEPAATSPGEPRRRNRSIFGRTPGLGNVPVPVIVGIVCLLAAVSILYIVFSRQSPLVGGDVGDTGQPAGPRIEQEAPLELE